MVGPLFIASLTRSVNAYTNSANAWQRNAKGVSTLVGILVRQPGLVVRDFDPSAYSEGADRIRSLIERDVRERCRSVAHAEFSLETVGVPRYDGIYQQVAATAR